MNTNTLKRIDKEITDEFGGFKSIVWDGKKKLFIVTLKNGRVIERG